MIKDNYGIFIASKKGINTGKGGFYFTLLSYLEVLENTSIVTVIHHNELSHPTIIDKKTSISLTNLHGFFTKLKILRRFFKASMPKYMFSFSTNGTSLIIRLCCKIYRCKYIYIKAGGGNSRSAQLFTNAIFFSVENFNAYHKKFSVNSFLISNRVSPFSPDKERISQLEKEFHNDLSKLKILRVSRVTKAYLPVFIATINLHISLQQKGVKVLTHLIGYPEDASAVAEIKEKIFQINDIYYLSDDKYINNTKAFLDFYDVVVGIGRGFWEGVLSKKLVLGYAKNYMEPILVNAENLEGFKKYNFSARTHVQNGVTFSEFIDNFKEHEIRNSYVEYLFKEFNINFSTNNLANKLKVVLEQSQFESYARIMLSILHYFYVYIVTSFKRP